MTVTIHLVNAAPFAVGDAYETRIEQALDVTDPALGVLGDDVDGDGDPLVATLVDDVAHGSLVLNADGTFTYTPDTGFTGTDTFTYTATDGLATDDPVTVTIAVRNRAPSSLADSFVVLHDGTLARSAADGVLRNDVEWDGDPLTVSLGSDVAHGTLVLNADGSFTYTPDAGYVGDDSFTYVASDGFVDGATTTVSITVRNTAPGSLDDDFLTGRDQSLTISADELLANDSDVDGDTLTVVVDTAPAYGTLVDNADGTWTYIPDPDYEGTDSFAYHATDGLADGPATTVTIEVENTTPSASADRFELPHDRPFSVAAGALLANDFDLDGNPLVVELVDDVAHGTLMLGGDGSLSYTPDAGFVGRDSFTYRVDDGLAESTPVTVTLDVVNSAPVLRGSFHRVLHDTTLTVTAADGLLSDASDAEEDVLAITLVVDPRHGSLTFQPDGSFTYTPDTGFTGRDSIAYRVGDGHRSSGTAIVEFDVTNTAPSPASDVYTTSVDTALTVGEGGVLENDFDFDQDGLSVSLFSGPDRGTVTLNADGTFVYTPNTGFAGNDEFVYRVTDGVDEAFGSVFVEVTGTATVADPAPRAGVDLYASRRGATLVVDADGGVLANDWDPDGDELTASVETSPQYGTLVLAADGSFSYTPDSGTSGQSTDSFEYLLSDGTHETVGSVTIRLLNTAPWALHAVFDVHQGETLDTTESGGLADVVGDADGDELTYLLVTAPTNGGVVLAADGTFVYTPNAGFSGHDKFTYRVNDGLVDGNDATVTIDVTNEAPRALEQTFRVQHDTTLTVAGSGVLAAAVDRDGDPLTAAVATGPQHGTLALATDGSFTYTPDAGFAGTDTFTFVANDGADDGRPVTITIEVENEAPEVFAGTFSTPHDTPLGGTLNLFDGDGDTLVVEVVDGVDSGTLSGISSDGTFTYTPNTGFVGSDSFRVRVGDGVTTSGEATITLNVTNVDPYAGDARYTIRPGETLEVDDEGLFRFAGDADGDALVIEVVTAPANGTLVLDVDDDVYTGGFTYTPDAGFAGEETFVFRVGDGAGFSENATVTINVDNSPPIAAEQRFRLHHRTGGHSIDLFQDGLAVRDPDDDPVTLVDVSGAQHGTVTFEADGSVTYTPTDPKFLGTETLTYVVSDGYVQTDPATLVIEIVNTAPEAVDDRFTTGHAGTLSFTVGDLLANDFDFDGDPLAFVESSTLAAGGTLEYAGGEFTFTPDGTLGGFTFEYTISDGPETATASVRISVVNDAAWAADSFLEGLQDEPVEGSLYDTEIWNPDGDSLTFGDVTQPGNGTLVVDPEGSFTYTPNAGFAGSDSFTYTLSDGLATTDPITVTIEIEPRIELSATGNDGGTVSYDEFYEYYGYYEYWNVGIEPPPLLIMATAPVAVADGPFEVVHGEDHVFSRSFLTANDFVPGYPTPFIAVVGLTDSTGLFSLDSGTGNITFHAPDAVGEYEFQYTIEYAGLQDTASVIVRTTNEAPGVSAADDDHYVYVTNAYSFDVAIAYFGDADDALEDLDLDISGDLDKLVIDEDHVWFTVPANWTGTQTFEYTITVTDPVGESDTVSFTLTISDEEEPEPDPPPPPPPVYVDARDDTIYWSGDTLAGNVLGNDWWETGSTVTVSGGGSGLVLASDGSFTYTPDGGGLALSYHLDGLEIGYTITDQNGETDSAVVRVKPVVIEANEGHTLYLDAEGEVTATIENESRGVPSLVVWSENGAAHARAVEEYGSYEIVAWSYDEEVTVDLQLHDVSSLRGLVVQVDGALLNSSLSVPEYLSITAGGDVGAVSAEDVRVSAANIGSVDASRNVIAAVATDEDAPPTIGSVTAGNDVYYVTTYDYDTHLEFLGTVSSVVAARDVGFVGGGYVGEVDAGRHVTTVWATLDVTGPVTAGGNIGRNYTAAGQPITDVPHHFYAYEFPYEIGGVYAGRDILDDVTASTGTIGYVHAVNHITGDITGDDVYHVRTEIGDLLGDVTAVGVLGEVRAERDVDSVIVARAIGDVTSGRHLSGSITSDEFVVFVHARENLSADVTVTGGDLVAITAGTSGSGSLTSNIIDVDGRITHIAAGSWQTHVGDVAPGTISAASIGRISATGSISTDATVDGSIGDVTAYSNVEGSLTALGGRIRSVTATTGSITATIVAATHLGNVTAHVDVTGPLTAHKIANVTATEGEITGPITGANGIGNVSAGTNIVETITSSGGNIGFITAGKHAPGNILGDITASLNIAGVRAVGDVPTDWTIYDLDELSNYAWNVTSWVVAQLAGSESAPPKPPKPQSGPAVSGGRLAGTVNAGANVGFVVADGDIEGRIEVLGKLAVVATISSVLDSVESGSGALDVIAMGEIRGSVDGSGNVYVGALGDVLGNITSATGMAEAASWGRLAGSVVGVEGAFAFGYDGIAGDAVNSAAGQAVVQSFGNVKSAVDGAHGAAVATIGRFDGSIDGRFKDTYVAALDGIEARVDGQRKAFVTSLEKIHVSAAGATATGWAYSSLTSLNVTGRDDYHASGGLYDGEIYVDVKNIVTGELRTNKGDVSVTSSIVNASVVTDDGSIGIEAFTGIGDRTIRASDNVLIRTHGAVNGATVRAGTGDVNIIASDSVAGSIRAGRDVLVHAWGSDGLNAGIDAGNDIDVFSVGSVGGDGTIEAGGDVRLDSFGGLEISVTANENVDLFVRHDVTKNVEAGKSATLVIGGGMTANVVAMDGSATVTTLEEFSGDVTASGKATVDAESISGTIRSTGAAADVIAFESVTGSVEGKSVSVVSAGSIYTLVVRAENSATVRALGVAAGGLSELNATSEYGLVTVNSATFVQDATVDAASATIVALDDVSETIVNTVAAARLFSGGTLDATVTSRSGNVEASSLGELTGNYTAGGNLTIWVAAGATADFAADGNANVAAAGDVSGTFDVKGDVHVTALGSVSTPASESGITAGGTAVVFAEQDVLSSVSATKNAVVIAGGSVTKDVRSDRQNATVAAVKASGLSNVEGDIWAYRTANVAAVGGEVSGRVDAVRGNANVIARWDVVESVTAGGNVNILAGGNVGGEDKTVSAGRRAVVWALSDVDGAVVAGSGGIVFAGEHVNADVSVLSGDAFVRSLTGNVEGDVQAATGSALVVALVDVVGNVAGGVHAAAVAVGDVKGDVSAFLGDALATSHGGRVMGETDAGRHALVYSFEEITGSVTAGVDAYVASLGDGTSSVAAGRDVVVTVAKNFNSPVTAGRHAYVEALERIDGNVAANSGDAVLVAGKDVISTVTAANDAYVVSGGQLADLTVNAGRDIGVRSFSEVTKLFANAGRDAGIWTIATLAGDVNADRDVGVTALAQSNAVLDAGRDVFAFVFGPSQNFVYADRDAHLTTMDAYHGVIDAERDAGLYAVGAIVGSTVDAGRYGSVVGWDFTGGVLQLGAVDGAFVWNYGTLNANVTATNGPAVVTGFSDLFNTNVTAGTDAVVTVVGSTTATRISAGNDIVFVPLAQANAELDAGRDTLIIGEGALQLDVETGRDLLVVNRDDVRGTYLAGRDASVITYGDFDAYLHADRDVGYDLAGDYNNFPGVWARGDVSGVISAGRDVGHYDEHHPLVNDWDYVVFAYGTVDATILARYDDQTLEGGSIGSVAGRDGVHGLFVADTSIGTVRSGDAVTATIVSPQVGSITEYDSAIYVDHPLPDVPPAVRGDVIAAGAAAHALVLGAKAELGEAITALAASRDQARREAADAVATMRDEVRERNRQFEEGSVAALGTARIALDASFDAIADAYAKTLVRLHELLDGSDIEQFVIAARAEAIASRNQLEQDRALVAAALIAQDGVVAEQQAAIQSDALSQREEWLAEYSRQTAEDRHDARWKQANEAWLRKWESRLDNLSLILSPTGLDFIPDYMSLEISIALDDDLTTIGWKAGLLAAPGLLSAAGQIGRRGDDVFDTVASTGARATARELVEKSAKRLHKPIDKIGEFSQAAKNKTDDILEQLKNGGCFVGDTLVHMEQEGAHSHALLVTAIGLATASVVAIVPPRRKRRVGAVRTSKSLLAHGPDVEEALYGPLPARVGMARTTATYVADVAGTCHDDRPESPAMFAVQPKPAPVEAESPRSHGRFLVPLMLLLAASLCGAIGWWGSPAATKPIAEVQLGERVHSVNPLGAESGEAEPSPATHRRVVFRMEKSGGELIDFELLWPLQRIRATGVVPGARIHLSMAELGGSGVAEVLAIGPCPPIARGTGSLVTGRFVHRVERVLEVETADGTTIGATPNHPFWSEATGSYRPIGEFRVGDQVRTRTGQLARLTSITPRDGPTTVYNLTVHGQHVYHVGTAGVLVHNKGPGFGKNAPESSWVSTQAKPLDYDGPYNEAFTSANSSRLRKDLKDSGVDMDGLEAHHIVPSTHTYPSAVRSRELLDDYRIDINSHLNGAALPNQLHHGNGLHSHTGMDAVLRRLEDAADRGDDWKSSREELLEELSTLRNEMQLGEFRF